MAKKTSEGETGTPFADAMHLLEGLLRDKRIQVYRSCAGTAYVQTYPVGPTDGVDLPDPKLHTELLGKDFRAWLAGLLWAKLNIALRKTQTDRLLEVLDAEAMKTTKAYASEMELIRSIEYDPLISVLVEFCHERSRFEMKAQPLWEALEAFVRSRGMLVRFRGRFPGGANAFTGRLRVLIPILQIHGLLVKMRRSCGCIVTIGPLDDAINESSTSSSATKINPNIDLAPMDDHRRSLLERAKAHKTQGDQK